MHCALVVVKSTNGYALELHDKSTNGTWIKTSPKDEKPQKLIKKATKIRDGDYLFLGPQVDEKFGWKMEYATVMNYA